MMDTLICPRGHSDIENRMGRIDNRGVTCRACSDLMVCEGCGAVSRRNRRSMKWPGVEWVGSKMLAELGLIDRPNPMDGGVYAVCQECRAALMIGQTNTSWPDLKRFGDSGGRVMRLEVPGAGKAPFLIGRDQLVALCDPHAATYTENYPDLIMPLPGTLTEATPCSFCFPPRVGHQQGPVLWWGGTYYTDAAKILSAMRQIESEAQAVVQFMSDNAGRIAGVRVLTEEEAERAEEESKADQAQGGSVSGRAAE